MASLEILGHACPLGVQLGAGGMGQVFAVDHPIAGELAVKLLQEALLGEAVFVDRVAKEGCAAARVAHANVVRIVDHGMTGAGVPFVAMARISGLPLGSLIHDGGPMSLARIRRIATQLLAGLAAIHAAGLVHADLKSDNLLLDAHDRLTIIDFGLAREATSTDDHHLISGTPEYMAPELIRGKGISPKSDLYAVGVILYELLTGTTPFAGGTASQIFERHLHDEVVPPSLRCPDRTVPRGLDELILRALAKDPRDRHCDAAELAAAVIAAIPETCLEETIHVHPVFSTAGVTRDWTRPRISPADLLGRSGGVTFEPA